MDISDIRPVTSASKGAWMTLKHPATYEPLTAQILVLGYDAPEVVQAQREKTRELREEKGNSDDVDPMDVILELKKTRVSTAIQEFKDFGWNGSPAVATEKFIKELVDDPDFLWIVDQVEIFGNERANFMKASPKS